MDSLTTQSIHFVGVCVSVCECVCSCVGGCVYVGGGG